LLLRSISYSLASRLVDETLLPLTIRNTVGIKIIIKFISSLCLLLLMVVAISTLCKCRYGRRVALFEIKSSEKTKPHTLITTIGNYLTLFRWQTLLSSHNFALLWQHS
jgi:hypothetical protein